MTTQITKQFATSEVPQPISYSKFENQIMDGLHKQWIFWIWSHVLKKPEMENFIFYAVTVVDMIFLTNQFTPLSIRVKICKPFANLLKVVNSESIVIDNLS